MNDNNTAPATAQAGQPREKFATRIGFILISAGCAIGLGNVWRFPYVTGEYGGAAFVLLYLLFLVILGLPILVMEFAVGRASQKSCARSFNILEPKGTKWHYYKWFAAGGQHHPDDVLHDRRRLDGGLRVRRPPRASSTAWGPKRSPASSPRCRPTRSRCSVG